MSSMMRGSTRSTVEAYCNPIVRRMVNLPKSLLGGFSRAMNHGLDLITTTAGRRNHNHPHVPPISTLNSPYPPENTTATHDEWAFLTAFEQQYGLSHPFFYACRFVETLKMAQDERKFVFLYLHSPEHPFVPAFCRETLCSELVVQFLDANFVCWGGLADRGEGLQMATTLRPASFPFCAVVAPASGNNLAVLQQIEGPVSPAELVEILQRTMEEQGLAFGSGRAKEEDKRKADQRLREEQDAAYLAALQIDQEKERLKKLTLEKTAKKQSESPKTASSHEKHRQISIKKQGSKVKEANTIKGAQSKDTSKEQGAQLTQILVRFPNGERREQSFMSTDNIQAIYRYIDSLGLPGVGSYKLVSSFPRKVYGVDQMGMTLKETGLHPRATLFLELM